MFVIMVVLGLVLCFCLFVGFLLFVWFGLVLKLFVQSPSKMSLVCVLVWAEQAVAWLFGGKDSTGDWTEIELHSGFIYVSF